MKIFKKLSAFILILFFLTGCELNGNNMADITIYTTTYPINFLINSLYGNYSKVYSIYPTGVNIDSYNLSKRKLKEYSQSELFVFNSLDKDRDYAVEMINLNKDLKVIDVTAGRMKYDYAIEELWLNPNNYLMMAENTKAGLAEYINNPYVVEEIDKKYQDLEYEISKLDAELTEAISGGNYKIIVTDNDMFKFLEKYGLKVISLENNENFNNNKLEEVKNLISSNKIKYIYSTSSSSNDVVSNLIKETNISLIQINSMRSIDGGISNSNDNYITIMTNNINALKKELYK